MKSWETAAREEADTIQRLFVELYPDGHYPPEFLGIIFMMGAKFGVSFAGRRGGESGGRARAAALSPERRSEIARTAALARHAKNKSEV